LNNSSLPTACVGTFVLSLEEAGARLDRLETTRPLGSPVRAQTRPPRLLLGRAAALEAARAFRPGGSAGLAFVGPAGCGKTALLEQLAADPVLRERFDLFVRVRVAGQPWDDVLAQIFRALHPGGEPPQLPASNDWVEELRNQRVGFALDDAEAPFELERLMRLVPEALVFASATEPLPALTTFRLAALSEKDASWLLWTMHPMSWSEQEPARTLALAAAGNPLRVKQIATLASAHPVAELARTVTSPATLDGLLGNSILRLDARQRSLLDAIGIFGTAAIEKDDPGARKLASEGLVIEREDGWRIAPALAARYEAPEEFVFRGALNSCAPTLAGTIATTNDPSRLQPVVAATKRAGELDRFGDVIDLGKATSNALARCGAWNQWRTVLDLVSAAAGRTGADGVQSWVLHQSGTRLACLGQTSDAQSMLRAALARRRAARDAAAMRLTEHNLGVIGGNRGKARFVAGAVSAVAAAAVIVLGATFALRPHAAASIADRPLSAATVALASAEPIAQEALPHPRPREANAAHRKPPVHKVQVVAAAPVPTVAPTPRPTPSAHASPATRATPQPSAKPRAAAKARTIALAPAAPQHYTKPEILAFGATRTLLTAGGTTHLCMSVRDAMRVRLTATSQAQTRDLPVPQAVRQGKTACIRIAPKTPTRYALHASSGPLQTFRILAIDVFQAPAADTTATP
jgi:outer membrane biosynthesis protein TonB